MESDTGYANGPMRTLNQCMWNGLYPPKPRSINTEIGCVSPSSELSHWAGCSYKASPSRLLGLQPQLQIQFGSGHREQVAPGALRGPTDEPKSGKAGLSLKGQLTQPELSGGTGDGKVSTFLIKLDLSTWTDM